MGRWEGEHCGRAVLPRRVANEHALHGFRAAGNEASRERAFPWPERRSARPAFAGAGQRSVGSDSVANRPSAPAEPEQEGRLVLVQQEETLGPPRRPAQYLLEGGHRRCGARPEHGTHPSRLERRARFLTLFAQRTGAAMANAGGIQHAHGAVAFWPTFLHKERMACWAAQRPIGLRRKHGTRKPMRKGGSRPVRWPVGRWPIQRVLRGLGFVCRESRREAKPRGQRERFRQREEQHLGKREEKEEDRHREGTWAAPEPANRPSPSRASWSPVHAAPTPSEGSRSTG